MLGVFSDGDFAAAFDNAAAAGDVAVAVAAASVPLTGVISTSLFSVEFVELTNAETESNDGVVTAAAAGAVDSLVGDCGCEAFVALPLFNDGVAGLALVDATGWICSCGGSDEIGTVKVLARAV